MDYSGRAGSAISGYYCQEPVKTNREARLPLYCLNVVRVGITLQLLLPPQSLTLEQLEQLAQPPTLVVPAQ